MLLVRFRDLPTVATSRAPGSGENQCGPDAQTRKLTAATPSRSISCGPIASCSRLLPSDSARTQGSAAPQIERLIPKCVAAFEGIPCELSAGSAPAMRCSDTKPLPGQSKGASPRATAAGSSVARPPANRLFTVPSGTAQLGGGGFVRFSLDEAQHNQQLVVSREVDEFPRSRINNVSWSGV